MTVSEVDEAQQEATVGQAGFVINVKEHKTNRAFGPAQLYLTVEEFSWVEQWMIIRQKLNPPTDLLLFTENFTKIEKLIVPMQAAWHDMGFPGRPTFTDFRTSIATYARNTLSPSDRINISKTMCHDTRTADKFYALHRTASELARIRQNFEAAVKPPRTTVHDTAEPSLLSMSESSGDGLEEEADCGPSHSPPAGPSPSSPTSSRATGSTSPDQASGSCYSPGSASSQRRLTRGPVRVTGASAVGSSNLQARLQTPAEVARDCAYFPRIGPHAWKRDRDAPSDPAVPHQASAAGRTSPGSGLLARAGGALGKHTFLSPSGRAPVRLSARKPID
ncbi:uncharacterized protein LOC118559109 [Fundulus heteroclitus]|uniref:uncharacterized protein LOC118559109 n=1 Tax=Fundulus heteroclitus TaxID=8078 RepID=UPI00165A9694|nr:uncharacterized protein LOC118559109 [Fundulus heteroclitus]